MFSSTHAPDRSSKQAPLPALGTARSYVEPPEERPGAEEFFSAALELAKLTDVFFGPDKSLESFRSDLDDRCKDLLGLYDGFLDILEDELRGSAQPASMPARFDPSKWQSLIRLHAAVECNRELISSLITAMQENAAAG
jgi:hypothetical protein